MAEGDPIRIIPHRGVDDDCGSLEVWFADGPKSVKVQLGQPCLAPVERQHPHEQAIEKATANVGRAASFLSASSSADPRIVSCVADSAGYVVD
jgi:hypothetical protein